MSENPCITTERQSQLLARLEELASARATAERTLHQTRVARQNAATSALESTREAETRGFEQTLRRLQSEHAGARNEAERQRRQDSLAVDGEEARFESAAPRDRQDRLEKAERQRDSAKLREEKRHQQLVETLRGEWLSFEASWNSGQAHVAQSAQELTAEADRRKTSLDAVDDTGFEFAGGYLERLQTAAAAIAAVRETLGELRSKPAAKFFDEGWTVLLLLFTALAAVYPAGKGLGWGTWHWAAAAVGAAVAVTLTARAAASWAVRRDAAVLLPAAAESQARAAAAMRASYGAAATAMEGRREQLKGELREKKRKLHKRCAEQCGEIQAEFQELVAATRDSIAQRRRSIEQQFAERSQRAEEKYVPAIAELRQRHAAAVEQLETRCREELQRSQRAYDEAMEQLVTRWQAGLAEFQDAVAAMNDYCDRRFPRWGQTDWEAWTPTAEAARAFPFGRYEVDIDQYGEAPEDPRLKASAPNQTLPAVLAFPEQPSLLLEASDEGKAEAVATMQTLMLRMLLAIPPGKLRFTIIDPEGLGQNFSAFMHLSDYDEKLVGPRIWTESSHIQQQLVDLREHTENVIQKYLRNEFASIQEYNARAGEVAEPFRILVVANFPENFTDEAARRLASIAASGPRCGVFTLISVDTRKKLPRDFFLDELEAHSTALQWTHNGFRPRDPRLRSLPLVMDSPPEESEFTAAVHAIGRKARDADRVEVPFAAVAPADESLYWQGDCGAELEVALGRAGASKLQYLRLGKGVSQHVLISGKTGSGKSTLLHALITNVALNYSPDEVEFYLIDFKKGVEFKPYATHQLPHARVIAVESEREFGMSVLERLDEELRSRGDLFRQAGVQDVAGFRAAQPGQPLPRVLLIIDEFQELFVKDDKIASDAALLLDRLVRQGRAFGMHVLLGSQTLAGAYSLARSTIGQMAVRIALQCSEADAHLILSEDNTAARLLNRPGEAIYNNANGRFEGNHPFQIVWLSDSERIERLAAVTELCHQRGRTAPPPIVFEGNVPAEPARNRELAAALQGEPGALSAPRVWLGEAVAIKPPTWIDLPRQSGANLLVVGAQEEMACGILGNAALALAAQFRGDRPDAAPAVDVLDGTRAEAPEGGAWRKIAAAAPAEIQVALASQTARVLTRLHAEMERRIGEADENASPHFLVIHGLGKFRDLRKADDDFGFSGFGEESAGASAPAADKMLQQLLREGPAWGLHCLIWCDSFNTASRWLDRQTLKDLELRVLFQMTASDSSNLMDSPAAAHLGVHRAILHSEEHGRHEKFRPYAAPDSEWLSLAAQWRNSVTQARA